VVNIKLLEARFEEGSEVTPEAMQSRGLIDDTTMPVKILGEGELTKKLSVSAAKFSAGARQKIEGAGGSCQPL